MAPHGLFACRHVASGEIVSCAFQYSTLFTPCFIAMNIFKFSSKPRSVPIELTKRKKGGGVNCELFGNQLNLEAPCIVSRVTTPGVCISLGVSTNCQPTVGDMTISFVAERYLKGKVVDAVSPPSLHVFVTKARGCIIVTMAGSQTPTPHPLFV